MRHNWKVKVNLLISSGIVFGMITYFFAIQTTLSQRNNFITAKKNQMEGKAILKEIGKYRVIVNNRGISNTGMNYFSEAETMVSLAENKGAIVKKLPDKHLVKVRDKQISYQSYAFTGSFTKLLKLLDTVEYDERINLLNARFFIEPKQGSKAPELILSLETANLIVGSADVDSSVFNQ